MPVQISPDGRWWWDGRQWRTRLAEGELSLFWFTETPEWASRVIVIGLIGLIPIVGGINMYGWALTTADMIRRGWRELPPANLSYLQRGVPYFVVGLVYAVVIWIVAIAMAAVAIALGVSDQSRIPLAVGIGALDFLFLLAIGAVGLYMFGAVLTASDRLGIGAGLNPLRMFALARANHDASMTIAVIYFGGILVVSVASGFVSLVIPFAGLAVSLFLPAIFALVVPGLARIQVEPPAVSASP